MKSKEPEIKVTWLKRWGSAERGRLGAFPAGYKSRVAEMVKAGIIILGHRELSTASAPLPEPPVADVVPAPATTAPAAAAPQPAATSLRLPRSGRAKAR